VPLRSSDLDEDLDLDPSFGFVEEAFDGGGYFLVGKDLAELGAFFFEGREEKAGGAAAEFGGVDVAVVSLLFVGGDHDEGAEAEIDVLFDRDALGDQAFEGVVLDRGETDLFETRFESGGGREIAERFGDLGGDLFVRRRRARQAFGLESEDALVDEDL